MLERVEIAAREFKAASDDLDAKRVALREAIRDAYAQGASVRAIARVSGLPSSRVHQIVSSR